MDTSLQQICDRNEAEIRYNDQRRAVGADVPGRLCAVEWQRLAVHQLKLARCGITPIEANVEAILAEMNGQLVIL